MTGTASNQATVTVREGTNTATQANRHDDYFWQVLDVDNSSAIFSTTNLQIRAYMTQVVGTNTNSLVRCEIRESIVAETPEVFAYDSDGNLLTDGLWTNTWNAENRLTCVESLSGVPDNKKIRVDYKYDYQGKMTERTVHSDYSGDSYQTTNTTVFLWDGYNPIAEIIDNVTTNFFTYGADLFGTLQGAGGVGGLLMVTLDSATNYFVAMDGNGNVMGLVSATDGSVDAEYSYSPFGELLQATGPQAGNNHFRYSTRYYDRETGLIMFPARPYLPPLGRFLACDPMGEWDKNRYAFAKNNPITTIDPFGLWGTDVHYTKTMGWAANIVGYKMSAAAAVADADEAVDGGPAGAGLGWAPWGYQGFHFNRNPSGSPDSRWSYYGYYISKAKHLCAWASGAGSDDPNEAVQALGTSLHPIQDWVAHGDFGLTQWPVVTSAHNSDSSQRTFGSDSIVYVDDPSLDAVDGPDGRPAGVGFQYISLGGTSKEWAIFEHGSKRITKTKELTTYGLESFLNHVRTNAKPCGQCRAFFLKDDDPRRYQ